MRSVLLVRQVQIQLSLDLQVLQAHKVKLDLQVLQAQQARKETSDQQARKVSKVFKVSKV